MKARKQSITPSATGVKSWKSFQLRFSLKNLLTSISEHLSIEKLPRFCENMLRQQEDGKMQSSSLALATPVMRKNMKTCTGSRVSSHSESESIVISKVKSSNESFLLVNLDAKSFEYFWSPKKSWWTWNAVESLLCLSHLIRIQYLTQNFGSIPRRAFNSFPQRSCFQHPSSREKTEFYWLLICCQSSLDTKSEFHLFAARIAQTC